jgi:hypothetical protein
VCRDVPRAGNWLRPVEFTRTVCCPLDMDAVSSGPGHRVLVSFDIDGTLEDGDPPGPLPMELVLLAKSLGYVVGSASDRTRREQREMWRRRSITVDFVGHKHNLDEVALDFPSERKIHIGDTEVDAHYARLAGFEFVHVLQFPARGADGWIF